MNSITAEKGKVLVNAFAIKAFEDAQIDIKNAASSIYRYAITVIPVPPALILFAQVICKPVERNAPTMTYCMMLKNSIAVCRKIKTT